MGLSDLAQNKRPVEIGGKTFQVGRLHMGDLAEFEADLLTERLARLRQAGFSPDECGAAAAAIQAEHTTQGCIRALTTPSGILRMMRIVLSKQDKGVTEKWIGERIDPLAAEGPVEDFVEALGVGKRESSNGEGDESKNAQTVGVS